MKKYRIEDIIFNTINTLIMLTLAVFTLYPFLNTLAISFNDGMDTLKGGINLLPRVFTLYNYKSILADTTINIKGAFFNSVLRTLIGTASSLILTAMLAYTISRKDFILKKPITVLYVFTMYFSGGIIPSYFLIKNLHLLNNFAVYIIPGLVNAFNLIVMRTFMEAIPDSLIESARIDGAGEFRIFRSIILPLCTPVLATIALFIAVGHWNTWFDTFLYCSSRTDLSTLQFELMKALSTSSNISDPNSIAAEASSGVVKNMVTPQSVRATITIIAAVPIILVYPFMQKYFITGLTLGGVKE